jgi:hypothetical protein
MNKYLIIAFVAILFLGGACTASRVVKPLEEKEVQIGLDVGGPRVNSQTIPLTSLHFAYGFRENLSMFGGIHTTTLGFQTIQLDFGWTYGVLDQKGIVPGIALNTVMNPMISLRDGAFRYYHELTPNFYWELGSKNKHLFHLGFNNWFDFAPGTFEIGEGHIWHPSLQAGYRYQMKRFVLAAEYRMLNINKEIVVPQATVPNLIGSGGHGFYFSVNYRFNHLKED